MKMILTILFASALSLLAASEAVAPVQPESAAPWYSSVSVSPFVAMRSINITDGPNRMGAGLDVGLGVNENVSLHLESVAYDENRWRGPAIDESSLLVKAKLSRFSTERFAPYVVGGATRTWGTDDWAFGIGLGVEYRFNEYLSIGADSRIRAYFRENKDLLTRLALNVSF